MIIEKTLMGNSIKRFSTIEEARKYFKNKDISSETILINEVDPKGGVTSLVKNISEKGLILFLNNSHKTKKDYGKEIKI